MPFRLAVIFFLFLSSQQAHAWGFWAHRRINYYAVDGLPAEMQTFFRKYRTYITDHSVDPDKRRHCSADEGQRHYIDLDLYGKHPFDSLPHRWKDAVERYGEELLKDRGTVPWHINLTYYNLVEAFRAKDAARILDLAAELGHYVSDACVPLHTTSNYDGQLTGQKGIHALWETTLPVFLSHTLRWDAITGRYVENVQDYAWDLVRGSYLALDTVLRAEKELSSSMSFRQKYCLVRKGKKIQTMYSDTFLRSYDRRMDGMVEKRLRLSVQALSSIWLSAWIDAGQPDLNGLVYVPEKKTKEEEGTEEEGE